MYQLIYISTAAPGMTEAMIGDILTVSRWNNTAAGVSGLLLYDGYRFLQALEGDMQEVQATYARVKADQRHRATVVLSQKAVEARGFGDWAMAAQRTAIARGDTLVDLVDSMTASLKDLNLQALFRGFVRVRAAA